LEYGRKAYYIPKTNEKTMKAIGRKRKYLVWKYGNKKIVYNRYLFGPIYVDKSDGLFFFQQTQAKVEEFMEKFRERIKDKIKRL